KLHGEVARQMWGGYDSICPISHVTNSQETEYWTDTYLDEAAEQQDFDILKTRKAELKKRLFKTVADQTGKLFDPKVLTIVWARRFAAYKRADLLTEDMQAFEAMIKDQDRPIQWIWAGKPYPKDYGAIAIFNKLIQLSKKYPNVAVLTGYELDLSAQLKKGSDVWLNTPRVTREASGTSGMTAAMNASVNLSTNDGWIPEFAKPGVNAFIVPEVARSSNHDVQDTHDRMHFFRLIESEIKPMYYNQPEKWWTLVRQSMIDVKQFFDSKRMATEYYTNLYPADAADRIQLPKMGNEGVSASG
ncbi:MAG: alpha-glucan family phosphorylase, partial [Bacteroidota bacterium]